MALTCSTCNRQFRARIIRSCCNQADILGFQAGLLRAISFEEFHPASIHIHFNPRVVNIGTSSKKELPMVLPGTTEVVPMVRNGKKVCTSGYIFIPMAEKLTELFHCMWRLSHKTCVFPFRLYRWIMDAS